MIEDHLKELGFSKNESSIYLALFELGKVRAGELIDHTALHRNIVYTALDGLVRRHMVTKTIKSGVAEFSANDPESLVDELNEKKRVAEAVAGALREKRESAPREVTVYEGKDGIKRSRNKTLEYPAGETLYVLGSKASTTPDMERYWRQFHKKREAKGIGLKILFERGVAPADLEWRNALPKSQAKYLPFKTDLPIWFAIIKDYLEIGIPGDDPLTFGIKSAEAAQGFQSFFQYFWDQKAATETGHIALRRTLYDMMEELRPGEAYYVLGGTYGKDPSQTREFYLRYHAERIKKGVVANILGTRDMIAEYRKRFPQIHKDCWRVTHLKEFLSPAPQPFQINLYNGKTKMIVYGKEPTVISFEGQEVYDGFKTYFDALWGKG
ncbi:MAG: helix-turn-helix domain-containing protein [Patescibacteria group bacterium]